MSFASPLALLALLAIPAVAALFAWMRSRRRKYTVRHPGVPVLRAAAAGAPRWRRLIAPLLLGLSAVAMALAFARPEATASVPVEKASVMLVTDRSGSMLANDVSPSRMDAAKDAARTFVDQVPDELLVGFQSYASSVSAAVEPTTDHDEVRDAIALTRAEGGTATGDALTAALDRLAARKGTDGSVAPAAIVLLSDGKTTEGTDPLRAAARADRMGIPVHTVALGTNGGIVFGPGGEPQAVPPDPETLRQISERSGGEAFAVDDAGELDRVYERLGSEVGVRKEQREVSSSFAGGALALLLGGMFAGVRWRGRVA